MAPAESGPPEETPSALKAQLAIVIAERDAFKAAYERMVNRSVERDIASARADQSGDMVRLKNAAQLAGVDEEWARRKHHDGEIISRQAKKNAPIWVLPSSLAEAVRKYRKPR